MRNVGQRAKGGGQHSKGGDQHVTMVDGRGQRRSGGRAAADLESEEVCNLDLMAALSRARVYRLHREVLPLLLGTRGAWGARLSVRGSACVRVRAGLPQPTPKARRARRRRMYFLREARCGVE